MREQLTRDVVEYQDSDPFSAQPMAQGDDEPTKSLEYVGNPLSIEIAGKIETILGFPIQW
jgi:hypothetical protein